MRVSRLLAGFSAAVLFAATFSHARTNSKSDTLKLSWLSQSVEILKDHWGISHIYARTQADLFFAQGFSAARDRLFQFEIWRRRALGLMAEIQGERALKHDIGARLLKLRQNMELEMQHYHPDGKEIITSFIIGINAYIDLTRRQAELLPLEFELLGIKPQHWTPEVVVSRHNGLFFGAQSEVNIARAVHALGADKTKSLYNFHHGQPDLGPKPGLDLSLIDENILELYNAARKAPPFAPEDIADPKLRGNADAVGALNLEMRPIDSINEYVNTYGSNNWVLSGNKTSSGFPIMANDPHRSLQVPSLRYWAHLVGPGWNVIGGGEPALPGLSIGHNEFGAWGLTIFLIDQEDIYVYDTNPNNPTEYRYAGEWEAMKIIEDTIPVKGTADARVELKYTRHGPVLFQDSQNHKAYALKAAWLEIGTAPYLASLRMDQARGWEEFREACSYSGTPPENMVWADRDGNIGWQAVGFTPIRRGWEGVLPVPGDGRFEWTGSLPIRSLPNVHNPSAGHWATSNQNNVPLDYPYLIGFTWSDPYRLHRVQEFLSSGRKVTIMDNMRLQQDELSLPARALAPLLRGLKSSNKRTQQSIDRLLKWDHIIDKQSVAAAIYVMWERKLEESLLELLLPEEAKKIFTSLSRVRMIEWLTSPDGQFGANPITGRDSLLVTSMDKAVDELPEKLGSNMGRWQYGQEKFHHSKLNHRLSQAVNPELQKKLNIGPLPKGGYGYTVNNTSGSDNQRSGGTFRIIADTGDWDRSVGTNAPGQSGNPDDPHYSDLFKMWADGKYFPVFYSRPKVESVADRRLVLIPAR